MALPDPTSFFFADAKPGSPLSLEALQTRRKIAEQLLGKRSPFPKTLGEGLTYFGESLADRARMNELDKLDAERQAGLQGQVREAGGALTGGSGVPAVPAVPPVRVAPRADTGDTAPEAPSVATAAVTPSSEGTIAAATEAVADPSLALPVDRSALAGALAAQQGFTPPAGSAADQPAPTPQAGVPIPPPRPRIDRTRINAEVQADPTLIPRMAMIAKGETSDPQGRRVIAETIANRAIARDQPLSQVMQQYTGPGSAGYYPASTFRNGAMTPEQAQAMQRDVIDPMLRGSDEGTQALGFAPTGNASGGVAARGVANGRYGNAGRLAGETYVTQERPEQLQRLAGARLASLGGGPITAAVAAGNAPIVRPDITPLPRVAQAATAQQPSPFGMGTIPLSPTAPVALPPASVSVGRAPTQPLEVLQMPQAPPPTPMSNDERKAILMQMRAPGDPAAAQIWGPVQQQEAAKRIMADKQNEEVYKAKIDAWKTDVSRRQLQAQNAPKTEAELQEAEYKSAEAGRQAAMANQMGGLPETERKAVSENYIKVLKPAVETIARGQDAIREARLALSQGAITGIGADARINWSRLMGFMGQSDQGNDAANSQLFKSLMQPVINAQRVAAAGSTNISNADIANAEKAAGANYQLEPKTIHQLLNILEKNGLTALQEYKQNSEAIFGTRRHPALHAVYGAPVFNTEPQRLPAPPKGSRVQVYSSEDAKRYPSGTEIVLPDGRHGTVP